MHGLAVGSFVLDQPLATGGMGAVWRARHVSGVPAALKIIPADAEDELYEAAAGLQAEIRAVGALDHPNIVRVYDAGALGPEHEEATQGRLRAGSPWLAMELADGSARDLLRDLDWDRLVNLLLQVLDGLSHAHARGVVHRDLKPANVLFTRRGGLRVLLADFGLAWAWRKDGPRVHGGSLPYAAPEQILGLQTELGPWTDLYGLGCTAYRLASGHRPFRGRTPDEIRKGHLFEPVPEVRARFAVPDGFAGWLAGLLAKDPRERFQRASDAAWALLGLPRPVRGHIEEDVEDHDTVTAQLGASGAYGSTSTLPLTQWAKLGPSAPSDAAAARVRAPLPADWSRPVERRALPLGGRGLGLFGLREPPMVGRKAERDRLWQALAPSSTGARVVVLRGAPGVGKSRLASWLCERAHEVGAAEVFRAAFRQVRTEGDGLSGLLEEHLRTHGMEAADIVRHLKHTMRAEGADAEALALARVMRPGDPSIGAGDTSAVRRIEVVWRLVAQRTAGRRMVVWLDDAHWSPEAVAFGEHALAAHGDRDVLLVYTARDDLLPAVLERRLRALVTASRGLELRVGPLGPGEVVELVEAMLPAKGDLAERIEGRANGSPLVAVQLVADLVHRGQVQGDPSGVWLESADALPASLASLWSDALDRLAALEPAARVALQVAAVLGTTFSHAEWREVCARLGTTLSTRLVAVVVERGFVLPERGGGRYSFSHVLLRDALVGEAHAKGPETELACAEALEARGEAFAARAGPHFEAAGAFSRAVSAYLAAVGWLQEWDRERALEIASRWYGALGRIATDTDPRWAQGMAVLVSLYAGHGGQAHRRAVEELAERGKATGDREAELRALIELARLDLRALAVERAEARAELALHRAKGTRLHTLAVVTRAEVRRHRRDLRGAEAALRAELQRVERGQDQPVVLALARVLCDLGRPSDGLGVLSEWADRQTRAQAPMARARLQRGRGHALLDLGRAAEAVAALEEAAAMRDRAGFDWPVLDLDLACARLAAERPGAREALEGLLGRFDAVREGRLRAEALVALAELDVQVGAFDDARARIRQALAIPRRGWRRTTLERLGRVARRAEQLGAVGLAEAALDAARPPE